MNQTRGRELRELLGRARQEGRLAHASSEATRKQLQRRAGAGGPLVSPLPRLYAEAGYWNSLGAKDQALHIVRGLARIHPSWVFCFLSAALVHGLEVSWYLPLRTAHIASDNTRVSPGVMRHAVGPIDCVEVDGVRVSTLPRTVFDCARSLSLPLALAVADSGSRLCAGGRDRLASEVRAVGTHKTAAARARAVMGLANPLSENGGESYARAVMLESGFATPELQVGIPDPLTGTVSYRGDFLWREARGGPVVGELDGRSKTDDALLLSGMTTSGALRQERLRESRITASGLRIARFSFGDVRAQAPLQRVLEAFGVPRDPNGFAPLPAPHDVPGRVRYASIR